MKRVLLIQSRTREDMISAERDNYVRAMGGLVQLDYLSTTDGKIAWKAPSYFIDPYDAFIFGGSAEFDIHGGREDRDPARLMSMIILSRIRMFMTYAIGANKPILGVCFGHQLIAEINGGNVTNDHRQKKCGTYEVTLTQEGKSDPLFSHLPSTFLAQYAHKDSVTSLPRGAVILAGGPGCNFSVLRYGQSVYTMQFHPELRAEESIAGLERSVGYLPKGVSAASLVRESPEASTILPLWYKHIIMRT